MKPTPFDAVASRTVRIPTLYRCRGFLSERGGPVLHLGESAHSQHNLHQDLT
ncbi:MAG: hypothetical protein ACOCW6_05105 [Spirochaetota bacterium]